MRYRKNKKPDPRAATPNEPGVLLCEQAILYTKAGLRVKVKIHAKFPLIQVNVEKPKAARKPRIKGVPVS